MSLLRLRSPLHVVILAAGMGRRMRSNLPKVVQTIGGIPIISHVLREAKALRPAKIHVVTAPKANELRKVVKPLGVSCVIQPVADGTGSAARIACDKIPVNATVLVLFADLPLLRSDSLRKLAAVARSGGLGLRTMEPPVATGYSRVVRDKSGELARLVTDNNATAAEKKIVEVDAGGMAFPAPWGKQALAGLKKSKNGEFILTDLVALARKANMPVKTVLVPPEEGAGVNTQAQRLAAESFLSKRVVDLLQKNGVLFSFPETVAIRGRVIAQPGAFIDRNVVFEGEVRLASNSSVGPNCVVKDTQLDEDACLHAFTDANGAQLAEGAQAGPFARLRPGTKLAAGAKVGNFVEVKAAKLGMGAKANHLAYIGDGQVGAEVNIGAGAVFCNYDGKNKHLTKIGDKAFIGSGSMLIAPVTIGQDSVVAAGSVITKDVPDGNVAFARDNQQNVDKKRLASSKSKKAGKNKKSK